MKATTELILRLAERLRERSDLLCDLAEDNEDTPVIEEVLDLVCWPPSEVLSNFVITALQERRR